MAAIYHGGAKYGGGSLIEPNPQGTPANDLESIGIDGVPYSIVDANAIHTSDVGIANGIAELDSNGKVPASQLPSYVDDVIEAYYDSVSDRFYEESTFTTVIPPESGKTWVDIPSNKSYRWTGSVYVRTDEGVQLGETSDTAYRGDRGKIAYDHSQSDHSGIKPAFTEASTRANIASGETIATILGKIKKFFSDLKTVAFTGAYSDLSGTPTIPAAQVNSDWDASSGVAQILHKPALATVATSGSYNDLSNKPTIPTVNNGTLTIQKNGSNVATFTANQSGNSTANITVPEVEETDTTNSTPYLYRASQNSGDRCYLRQLVGASFGVNQLVSNGNFADTSGWSTASATLTVSGNVGTLTASATNGRIAQSISFLANHKYLVMYTVKSTTAGNIKVKVASTYSTTTEKFYEETINSTNYVTKTAIFTASQNAIYAFIVISDGSALTINIKNVNLIDLTQWFNAQIADYAATAGFSWLRNQGHLTKDYYPYNTGTTVSVQTSGKVCWGKNRLNATPKISTAAGITYNLLNDNFLTVKGTGTGNSDFYFDIEQITFHKGETWHFGILNLNGNFNSNDVGIWLGSGHARYLGTITASNGYHLSYTFTNDETYDVMYYRHYLNNTPNYSANMYLAKVQLTSYESYESHTTSISPIDLRGVPKLVDNNIVYDGDVRDESGTVTRKYKRYDLGVYNWTQAGTTETKTNWYTTGLTDIKKVDGYTAFHGMCTMFNAVSQSATWQPYDMALIGGQTILYVCTPPNAYADATQLKAALSGVYLDAEIETPYTEQTTPIQNPQIYNSNGTEQFIDNRTVPIPVGHNSEYVNLPDWLENGYYKDFRQRVDERIGSDGNFNGNALTATLATKATQDGDGNTISSTYLKNSNVLMKNGDANVSPAGYRNIGGTNDYITLSEAGTYLITAWAMFKGGTGNKAVLICRASDNAAYGQSWESSTINQSYPKTFTCFHVATVTSTTLYFRARVYTENTDVYGGISGGIYAIKVS